MALLLRSTRQYLPNLLKCTSPLYGGICCKIFSESVLGLDQYRKHRTLTEHQFKYIKPNFKKSMADVVKDENAMVFTEDLRNFVHICEGSEEEFSLLLEMMKRFNGQNKGLRFGSYVFGPVVMRMYYHLNCPDEALKVLRTPELEGFFDQQTSYQILMNLLYKNEKHELNLELMQEISEKRLGFYKYPRSCLTIAIASCYKMNTLESLEKANNYLKIIVEVGGSFTRRIFTLVAGLALCQGMSHVALELVDQANQPSYVTVKNIKAMALTDLGRISDAVAILRSAAAVDLPDQERSQMQLPVLRETVERVEAGIKERNNKELLAEFNTIKQALTSYNYISEESLDDLLTKPIEEIVRPNMKQERLMVSSSFVRENRGKGHIPHRRKGLAELE